MNAMQEEIKYSMISLDANYYLITAVSTADERQRRRHDGMWHACRADSRAQRAQAGGWRQEAGGDEAFEIKSNQLICI
jgi:hypothetical protein